MAKEEKLSSGALKYASKYVGVGVGAIVVAGKGVAGACEKGAKSVAGLLPCKCKDEQAEEPAAEPCCAVPEAPPAEEPKAAVAKAKPKERVAAKPAKTAEAEESPETDSGK